MNPFEELKANLEVLRAIETLEYHDKNHLSLGLATNPRFASETKIGLLNESLNLLPRIKQVTP